MPKGQGSTGVTDHAARVVALLAWVCAGLAANGQAQSPAPEQPASAPAVTAPVVPGEAPSGLTPVVPMIADDEPAADGDAEPAVTPPAAPPDAADEGGDETLRPTVDLGSQVFFDARQTGFTRDTTKQVFEGDVVAIGVGSLIAADKILFDRAANIVEAEGRIVVLSRTQLFLGDAMTYHLGTGDFRLTNAVMLVNDQGQIDEVTRRIFGFSASEVEFEKARQSRLQEVSARKRRLGREARRQAPQGQVSDDLIDRYIVLEEQEEQIQSQENPVLGKLGKERRDAFKRRRDFWDASRKAALKVENPTLETAYFHLEGEEITRVRGNDYEARNALFTPCLCEKDESPAWAFRADRVEAQIGGYADLHHPVLEIKGIPMLYLPYLKLPLKDRRQSGFLLPTTGYERRSGTTFTQPVFFDLGPDKDATFTMDVYENRGTRLGLEYRIQQREYSGWDLKLEGIRDRLWMRDRALREDVGDLYRDGLAYAAGVARGDPPVPSSGEARTDRDYVQRQLRSMDYWGFSPATTDAEREAITTRQQALRQTIDERMLVPENTWRGAYGWRGVSFLAPRLSVVSNGEITSDHRYTEELYVPDDYQDAFLGSRDARAFSTAKAQLHLDGKDYYVGTGTGFGDNYLLDERFQGQQLPLRLKVLSRSLSLLPDGSPVPVYADLMGENIRITEFKPRQEDDVDAATAVPSLGDGNWRRLKLDTIAPLLSDSIIQVSQFNELEARYVEHASLASPRSEIRSWRTGVEFRLPIDGTRPLPQMFQDDEDDLAAAAPAGEVSVADDEPRTKYLHHIMDWRLRISARPSVVKSGPYTDPLAENGDEAYFAGDVAMIPDRSDVDNAVPEEERMSRHRRVTLITDHIWKLFRRGWKVLPGAGEAPGNKAGGAGEPVAPVDRRERARRELLALKPLSGIEDLYDEAGNQWLIDRYRLEDEYYEAPLTFHGDIAYDLLDAEERPRQLAERRALDEEIAVQTDRLGADDPSVRALRRQRDAIAPAEPWKDPNFALGVNYASWRFNADATYSVYRKAAKSLGMGLAPPQFFATNISLGYTVGKKYHDPDVPPVITYERSFGLATSLIPKVITDIRVSRQTVEGHAQSYSKDYKVATGVNYQSPSKCWGLQFVRSKEYNEDEANADYLLRLNIVFMGQQRGLPDMSPGMRRQVGEDPDQEGAG